MLELKVFEMTGHFNGSVWFEVIELESGETLIDVDSKLEAESRMLQLIGKNADIYFTNQDVMHGYAYSLTRCGAGTDKFGVCEVCEKSADSVYLLTEMVRYWSPVQKGESVSFSGCRPGTFGHKECLAELTFSRFPSKKVNSQTNVHHVEQ